MDKNSLKVYLRGRLGNQLFQYAMAYSLAKELNTDFQLYPTNHKNIIKQYFKLQSDKTSVDTYLKRYYYYQFRRIIQKYLKIRLLPKTELLTGIQIHDDLVMRRNEILHGFFQSDQYFKNYSRDLQKEFEIKNELKNEFEIKAADVLNKKYVACHIRRNDYLKYNNKEVNIDNAVLPLSYYKKVLDKVKDEYELIVFVSDDQKFIEENFKEISNARIFSESEIDDFQMIKNADCCIIANSTFSWWASYLNTKEEKKVYAPYNWLGHNHRIEYPKGIMTSEFNWIK